MAPSPPNNNNNNNNNKIFNFHLGTTKIIAKLLVPSYTYSFNFVWLYEITWQLFTDLPLYPNPRFESDTSNLNLSWSPSFLWPGHAIQYFNVTYTNKSDGSVTYHQINSTFDDKVVSFTRNIQEEPLMCTEIVMTISAISAYSFSTFQQPLQMFNVTDRILPSCKLTAISII